MPSASGFSLLFEHFVGSTRPSDFPTTCMLDSWFMTFSNRPAHVIVTGVAGVSRFSRVEFPCMLGFSDCAESSESSRWRFPRCGLPSRWTTSALRIHLFRSSMSRLHVPLSTLRVQPCDWPRMTRGQDGSLCLSCVTLSFTTPCRFLPAHPPYRRVRIRRFSKLSPDGPEVRVVVRHKGFAALQVSVSASPSSEPVKLSRS
jgi:hypothetical protein